MAEIIYILTNEVMPGLIKIGKTGRDRHELALRIRELYQTGVPLPFELYFACEVNDANFVERQMHDAFDDHRVSKKREFFRLAPERAKAALLIGALQEVRLGDEIFESKEDKREVEAAKRRSRFQFSLLDIAVGTTLALYKDPSITCLTVDDKNKVEFKDQVTSLSDAALQALQDLGYNWAAAMGAWEWTLDGERLDDLRRRIEDGAD